MWLWLHQTHSRDNSNWTSLQWKKRGQTTKISAWNSSQLKAVRIIRMLFKNFAVFPSKIRKEIMVCNRKEKWKEKKEKNKKKRENHAQLIELFGFSRSGSLKLEFKYKSHRTMVHVLAEFLLYLWYPQMTWITTEWSNRAGFCLAVNSCTATVEVVGCGVTSFIT